MCTRRQHLYVLGTRIRRDLHAGSLRQVYRKGSTALSLLPPGLVCIPPLPISLLYCTGWRDTAPSRQRASFSCDTVGPAGCGQVATRCPNLPHLKHLPFQYDLSAGCSLDWGGSRRLGGAIGAAATPQIGANLIASLGGNSGHKPRSRPDSNFSHRSSSVSASRSLLDSD